MAETREIEVLRAKVAELEAEKLELQQSGDPAAPAKKPSKHRGRTISAVVLVLIAALLAPVALISSWARAELVDTTRFVETFAPLAQDPDVQTFIAGEVSTGIKDNVDIDGIVGDLFTGISSLDLPPQTQTVLPLVEGAAANGVRSLIDTGVQKLVQSPQFASIWEMTLRETHSRAIAVIQGDPNSEIKLQDGTLSLDLKVVTAEVKSALLAQGFSFAEVIPVIDESVPLLESDSLTLMRTLYQLAVGVGYWLPWVVLGLLIAGVVVARNRLRALAWGAVGIAASLLLLSGGMGIGKMFFMSAVSPSVMPAATAEVLFTQLTGLISASLLALVTLSLMIAFGAWFAGSSKLARATRSAFDSAFRAIRKAADAHGLNPGAFGRFIERWHSAIVLLTVVVGVLLLFVNRPIRLGGIIGTLVCVLLVLMLTELLRRPLQSADEAGDAAADIVVEAEASEAPDTVAATAAAAGSTKPSA